MLLVCCHKHGLCKISRERSPMDSDPVSEAPKLEEIWGLNNSLWMISMCRGTRLSQLIHAISLVLLATMINYLSKLVVALHMQYPINWSWWLVNKIQWVTVPIAFVTSIKYYLDSYTEYIAGYGGDYVTEIYYWNRDIRDWWLIAQMRHTTFLNTTIDML